MIDLSLLPDGGMGWLDASGPKGSIVLSTRIRLARNLDGYVFGQRAKDADRTAVLTRVAEASAASELLQGAVTIRLDQLERVDRQLLHERHLVSKELAGLDREARPRPGAALVVQEGWMPIWGGCCPSRFTPNLAILPPAPPMPGPDSGRACLSTCRASS